MHILIVDNDRDSSDLVCHALYKAGYQIFQAHGVAHALRLSSLYPDIGCVVTDLHLDHQVTGMDMARCMRRRLRNSHYIVASGDWDALRGSCPHDMSVLRKPYGKTELLRAVRYAISPRLNDPAVPAHRRRTARRVWHAQPPPS